jgi:hypothetical protein
MNSAVGWDVPEDDPRCLDWQTSDHKLSTTFHALSHGWPSVAGGIEVSVEVRSNAGDLVEECAACRCFCIRTDLSFQPDQPFILQHHRYFLLDTRICRNTDHVISVRLVYKICHMCSSVGSLDPR